MYNDKIVDIDAKDVHKYPKEFILDEVVEYKHVNKYKNKPRHTVEK